MFKFLKLRNSVFGDARRHVPFTSIIHKTLFVLIAFVFSFVAIVPIKVNAAAPQIRPQFKPILDTDIVNFQDSYLNLDPAAQAAVSLLFGAYVTEYAGLADYGYVFDEVPTEASFKERLIFMGDQLVDTLFLPVNMADQLVLTPLINLGQGIINKVKGVTNVDDFYDDILDASDYGLSYTPDIGFALNQVFANSGGLYNWQQVEIPFSYQFQYNTGNTNATYESYLSSLSIPRYMINPAYTSVANNVLGDDLKFDLFIDTSVNKVYLVNLNEDLYTDIVYMSNNTAYQTRTQLNTNRLNISLYTYDNYAELINKVFTQFSITSPSFVLGFFSFRVPGYGSNQYMIPYFPQIIDRYLVGNNYATAAEVTQQSDLGFSQTDSLQLLNPIKDAVFDLKQLVQQIVQQQPDPNYELPLQPIIYNITQVEGSPLTAEDLQGISFNVTPPESGIDVPVNAFLPMFDNGKGFISYMWYMTKPLITYTRSLLDALTFDPVDGFNASGPGYFVLGVAGLGLIGGVIVKFLL